MQVCLAPYPPPPPTIDVLSSRTWQMIQQKLRGAETFFSITNRQDCMQYHARTIVQYFFSDYCEVLKNAVPSVPPADHQVKIYTNMIERSYALLLMRYIVVRFVFFEYI